MHRATRALALAGVTALLVGPAVPALAHGDEHIGDLELTIGFGTEPAYAGFPNSVEVLLVHDGQPVTDAKGLTVDVTFGDDTATYDLEPNFAVGVYGDPGDYRAWFVPSQPGPYTFHILGTVDGEDVDVEMTSGDDTFSEVQDTSEAAFPPVDVPSNQELADRLEADGARVGTAQAAAQQASDDASSTRAIAIVGVIVGAIGLIAALAALARSRKRT
jgi:hypothetical protein